MINKCVFVVKKAGCLNYIFLFLLLFLESSMALDGIGLLKLRFFLITLL
jgi:hypothetical protein